MISGLKGKFKNVKSNVNYAKGLVPEQIIMVYLIQIENVYKLYFMHLDDVKFKLEI